MSLVERFANKLGEYINQAINEFAISGYEEHNLESLQFIIVNKPVLRLMIDLTPEISEKKELEHYLTNQKITGTMGKILSSKLLPINNIIKKFFGRVSPEKMIESIIYSDEYNNLLNFVYEALRYKNNEEIIKPDHKWLHKP